MKREGKLTEMAARAMVTLAFFERLAHNFQNVALKFGKLVEKNNAVVARAKLRRDAESRRRRSGRRH